MGRQRAGSLQELSALFVWNGALKQFHISRGAPKSFLIKHLWIWYFFGIGR